MKFHSKFLMNSKGDEIFHLKFHDEKNMQSLVINIWIDFGWIIGKLRVGIFEHAFYLDIFHPLCHHIDKSGRRRGGATVHMVPKRVRVAWHFTGSVFLKLKKSMVVPLSREKIKGRKKGCLSKHLAVHSWCFLKLSKNETIKKHKNNIRNNTFFVVLEKRPVTDCEEFMCLPSFWWGALVTRWPDKAHNHLKLW